VSVIGSMFFFHPLLYQMRFYALTRPRLDVYVAAHIKRHITYTCKTISHSRPFRLPIPLFYDDVL